MTPNLFERRIACFINRLKLSGRKVSRYHFKVAVGINSRGVRIYEDKKVYERYGLADPSYLHPLDMFLIGKVIHFNDLWADLSYYSGVSIPDIRSFFAGFMPPEYEGMYFSSNKIFEQIGKRSVNLI